MWANATVVETQTNPFDSDKSAYDTVRLMIDLARQAATSPQIHSIVDGLLLNLPKNPTKLDLARSIWWWVKNKVRFVEDEYIMEGMGITEEQMNGKMGMDLLIHPLVLIQQVNPVGDCDDFSMLVASLCLAAHISPMYAVVAANPNDPERLSHVYVKAEVENGWIVLDASHGSYPGWETRTKFKELDWKI